MNKLINVEVFAFSREGKEILELLGDNDEIYYITNIYSIEHNADKGPRCQAKFNIEDQKLSEIDVDVKAFLSKEEVRKALSNIDDDL